MFIYSVKGSLVKAAAAAHAVVIAAAVAAAVFFGGESSDASYYYPEGSIPRVAVKTAKELSGIKTAADRKALLISYGWDVEDEPFEIAEVVIPKTFDAVYTKYNELLKGDGFDLSGYRGKTVRRYTYIVKNHEYKGTVYAELLISGDRVIGADVCSANADGFIHGINKNNNIIL